MKNNNWYYNTSSDDEEWNNLNRKYSTILVISRKKNRMSIFKSHKWNVLTKRSFSLFYFSSPLVNLSEKPYMTKVSEPNTNSENPAVQTCYFFCIESPHGRWHFNLSLFKRTFLSQSNRKLSIHENLYPRQITNLAICNVLLEKQRNIKLNKFRGNLCLQKIVHLR